MENRDVQVADQDLSYLNFSEFYPHRKFKNKAEAIKELNQKQKMLAAPQLSATTKKSIKKSSAESDLNFIRSLYQSKDATQDLDGDGKTDIWREFYPNGKLKTYKSSNYGKGVPDLIIYYKPDGLAYRRQVDRFAKGQFDVEVTYLDLPEGRVELTAERDPGAKEFNRWSRLWKTKDGYFKQKIEVDSNHDGKIDRSYETDIDERAWYDEGSSTAGCPPGFDGPLESAEIDEVVRELTARISVDSSCEGFSFTPGGTTYTVDSLREKVAQALRRGIGCLRRTTPGSLETPGGRRIVESALANVFASGRSLPIKCRPPGSLRTCPGHGSQGEYCARAATFADVDNYPSMSLVGNCGRPESAFDGVIFHEFLHLGGSCNHQFIHQYTSVEQTEVVETCSQCCMGSWRSDLPAAVERRQQYCNLCNDQPSDPVENNLRYGILASVAGDHGIAMDELEKVVAAEPGNTEAWSHLLNTYYRLYTQADADLDQAVRNVRRMTELTDEQREERLETYRNRKFAYVLRMNYAFRRLVHLSRNPSERSSRGRALPDLMPAVGPLGSLTQEILRTEFDQTPPPRGLQGLGEEIKTRVRSYYYHTTQFNITKARCNDFNFSSDETTVPRELRARSCFQQLQSSIRGMKQNSDWLRTERRRLSESGDESAAGELSLDKVEEWANSSDRLAARLTCLEQETPASECVIPPRLTSSSAPVASASGPSPAPPSAPLDCPPPPASGF